jgi:hypothetical protein
LRFNNSQKWYLSHNKELGERGVFKDRFDRLISGLVVTETSNPVSLKVIIGGIR